MQEIFGKVEKNARCNVNRIHWKTDEDVLVNVNHQPKDNFHHNGGAIEPPQLQSVDIKENPNLSINL